MNECDVIANLWIALNPHCQVHGCEIDPAGSVHIYVLYWRELKWQPLQLTLGNPPKTVIRGLRQAVTAAARERRLSSSRSQLVPQGEAVGISIAGEEGERDK